MSFDCVLLVCGGVNLSTSSSTRFRQHCEGCESDLPIAKVLVQRSHPLSAKSCRTSLSTSLVFSLLCMYCTLMTAPSPLALTSLRPLLSLAPPLLVTHLPPSVTVAKSPNKASPKGTSPNKGKGKATPTTASPSAVSTTLSSPSKQAPGEEDNDLLDLAESITGKAHLLIPGLTDDTLVRRAQEVVKASFDRGAFFNRPSTFASWSCSCCKASIELDQSTESLWSIILSQNSCGETFLCILC